MPSVRAIYKDSKQTAEQDQRENEQQTRFAAAHLIDEFEFIKKGFEEGAMTREPPRP